MKLIIEREATDKNITDIEIKITKKKSSRAFYEGNTMKQDMLNSEINLTSQARRGSLSLK